MCTRTLMLALAVVAAATASIDATGQSPAPATTTPAATKSEPQAAAGASQTPSVKPQSASAASSSASTTPEKADAATRGYDRVVVRGKTLFCRTEPIPGSHMRQRVCLTEAQLQVQQQSAQRLIEQMQRAAGSGGQSTMMQQGPMGH